MPSTTRPDKGVEVSVPRLRIDVGKTGASQSFVDVELDGRSYSLKAAVAQTLADGIYEKLHLAGETSARIDAAVACRADGLKARSDRVTDGQR